MDTAYKTTLELDKIIARAVQLCTCQETKVRMQALEPCPSTEEERYALSQTASVTLQDLRRKIRQTEDSIRTKLDNIIKNSTTSKFLQDAVVSLRNGRYVVPVRSEYRG